MFRQEPEAARYTKMAPRPHTPDDEHYPEVVQTPRSTFNTYDSSYEYYLPVEADEAEHIPPQRSPAPDYQTLPGSPHFSPNSPRISAGTATGTGTGTLGATSSRGFHSPSNSDAGWRSNPKSQQFSEFSSPDPQTVYIPPVTEEKQAYTPPAPEHGQPEYYGIKRKPISSIEPIPVATEQHVQGSKNKPLYKRPLCLILAFVALMAIIVAVVVGVVVGMKKSKTSSHTSGGVEITGDPNLAVGGYLSPSYYSHTGAFNGSGVALAAANPGVDKTIYVFYQDYTGRMTYKLLQQDGTLSGTLGYVNDDNSTPLNGTPISIVAHSPTKGNEVYHFFYIDSNYTVVERILQTGATNSTGSTIPVWYDGPLTANRLKTMNAKSIGLQACFWNNYYGGYNTNSKYATDAIQLWFATSETSFAQYHWTNGTSTWEFDQDWNNLDGHAGVGCQTWDSWQTEYVFFVDLEQNMALYWRDNNETAPSTATHPTLQWNKIQNISIPNVQRSSSLGYTTYMLYQGSDSSIRGVNISWAAENTTIGLNTAGQPDLFEITDINDNNAVPAIRGTHLSITALTTASSGAILQAYFQTNGTDITQYTRDMRQINGIWQLGAKVV